MKSVLCYGDSLTWGYNPVGPSRHAYEDRWPNVLQAGLGDEAVVIVDGLNGRTTAFDDHLADCDRNGARILPTALHTHLPLDAVIFLLGTNDLKPGIAGSALLATQGMRRLVALTRNHVSPMYKTAPDILVIAPPPLCETAETEFAAMFAGGIEQSQMLGSLYADLADEQGVGFFDASSVAETTPIDGVHLDAANTKAIGKALVPITKAMLGL